MSRHGDDRQRRLLGIQEVVEQKGNQQAMWPQVATGRSVQRKTDE